MTRAINPVTFAACNTRPTALDGRGSDRSSPQTSAVGFGPVMDAKTSPAHDLLPRLEAKRETLAAKYQRLKESPRSQACLICEAELRAVVMAIFAVEQQV